MRKIIFIVLLFASFNAIVAQNKDSIFIKSNINIDIINQWSPWLKTNNATALSYNDLGFNFSTINAKVDYSTGDYRNYYSSTSSESMQFGTESYFNYNKLSFYGKFKYHRDWKHNETYLGQVFPGEIINPIIDSIPGLGMNKIYSLAAKFSYKSDNNFLFGALFDYLVGNSVKRTDGRNLNTISKLRVSPGISYDTKYFRYGLNFNYCHNNENVNFSFIGDPTGKFIYYYEGLFMYSSSAISNETILERSYDTNLFGGDLQFELKLKNFSFMNNINVDYSYENDFEDAYLTKRFARVESLKYSYSGYIKIVSDKVTHFIDINYSNLQKKSYHIINNYEKIPGEYNQWAFFEYGKQLRYITKQNNFSMAYNVFLKRNGDIASDNFGIFCNIFDVENNNKIYPAHYMQDYLIQNYGIKANHKFFINNKSIVNFGAIGEVKIGSGNSLKVISEYDLGNIKLNKKLLLEDYNYRVNNSSRITTNLSYSFCFNRQKSINMNMKYMFDFLLKDIDYNRHTISMNIEYIF